MARHKDTEWNLNDKVNTWEEIGIAVLLDIRDELKGIRSRLDCYETLTIPRLLSTIAKNTQRKRKRKV